MRALVLSLLLLLPAPLAAQAREPLQYTRPPMNPSGVGTLPMMVIDERELPQALFEHVAYPLKPWTEAMECLAEQGVVGYVGDANQGPPPVLVVPVVRTIRVGDITLDSLLYAEDSTHIGQSFTSPTIAYSLVRTGVLLIVDRYRENVPLLRHEALHFLIWESIREYGHPAWAFFPCDSGYEEKSE